MRRGLVFLSVAFTPPAARGQARPQALFGDIVPLEYDQIPEDGALGSGRENRLRPTPEVVATLPSESASDGAESGDDLQVMDIAHQRDYLNALVKESVANGDKQLCNLAFLKTHKTGSTTLSSLFYRYGVRHGLKVAQYDNGHRQIGKPLPIETAFPKIVEQCQGRVDIMHYHIGPSASLEMTWSVAAEHYKTIMRDPGNINFVTIFREPRSHFLSFFYYFIAHSPGKGHVENFLLKPSHSRDRYWEVMHNPVAGELGITTQQELDDFVDNAIPKFKAVLTTDRFTEGLMLLRNIFGWDLIDLSYTSLNETKLKKSGTMNKNADKKKGAEARRPTFDDLSIQAQNKIDELTSMDRVIYEAGKSQFEKTLAPLARQVEADVAGFNSLQEIVSEYLESNKTSLARDMYSYEDFFRYFPPASPF